MLRIKKIKTFRLVYILQKLYIYDIHLFYNTYISFFITLDNNNKSDKENII